jgi:hypothetical protein
MNLVTALDQDVDIVICEGCDLERLRESAIIAA